MPKDEPKAPEVKAPEAKAPAKAPEPKAAPAAIAQPEPQPGPVVVGPPADESPEDKAARIKAIKDRVAVDMDGQRKIISDLEDELVRARLRLEGMIREHNLAGR